MLLKDFKLPQFVLWKYEMKDDGKKTKVPYYTSTKKASTTNPATWLTLEDALSIHKTYPNQLDGVGIVFDGKGIVGVDIDKVLEIDGEVKDGDKKEEIEKFIKASNTYCEISPSTTGLHLLFFITDIKNLILKVNKKHPYEVYKSGRYFTMTNNLYKESKDEIRELDSNSFIKLLSLINLVIPSTEMDLKEQNTESYKSSVDQPILQKDIPDDDQTILDKMFSSKHGSEIQSLYRGDTSAHNSDESSADFTLCLHLSFWFCKDPVKMESYWLQSGLGAREKVRTRKDYRERTINTAIAKTKQVYNPNGHNDFYKYYKNVSKYLPQRSSAQDANQISYDEIIQQLLDFKLDFKIVEGKYVFPNSINNIFILLREDKTFKELNLKFDEFKQVNMFFDKENEVFRPLIDIDVINIQRLITHLYPDNFSAVSKEKARDAITALCYENRFDSAADYVKGLVWDQKARVQNFLSSAYHVEVSKYHQYVSKTFLLGLVSRMTNPGCKFDFVLVLEGAQGLRKTTSLLELGQEFYTETTLSVDNKDFFLQIEGKSIVEFSEGETLSRSEVKKLKSIITTQVDKYRKPYAVNSEEHKRRCVFVMTTNEEQYLKDDTGNRRWLPVKIDRSANTNWIKENRDQLFAEAYHMVLAKKNHFIETDKELEKHITDIQGDRMIDSPNIDKILNWYHKLPIEVRVKGVSIQKAFNEIFDPDNARMMSFFDSQNIVKIFRQNLKLVSKRVWVGTARPTYYFPNPEREKDYVLTEDVNTSLWNNGKIAYEDKIEEFEVKKITN